MSKSYLLFCLLTLLSVTTLSAQLPDSCGSSALVRKHYLNSAKIIALRQMLGDSALADSIYIPATLYNPVLNALSAVYNATQYPERDTVVECLDIQAWPFPISPVGFTLTTDTSDTWAKNLHHDIFPTGNAVVDDLLLRYHLHKTSSYQFAKFFFFFQTDELLNTAALATLFNSIPGAHADPDGFLGFRNDLVLDTLASGVTLTYRVGWGDCPAGCIFDRSWSFLVKPDCSVEFIGVQGDPLTSEVACSSIFDCTTQPLCLPWLQDTLQSYIAQNNDCQELTSGIHVTLHQDFNAVPVIGIHVFIGIDAAFTDFYYCNGDYIGSCQITIGGAGCTPASVSAYFDFATDTIWDCTQPLPTAENCGITAAPIPAVDPISFQILPNPATVGEVTINANFGTRSKGRIMVFDLLGKSILEKTFDADQLTERLDLASQKPGLYFVRLESARQMATRKLLIIAP